MGSNVFAVMTLVIGVLLLLWGGFALFKERRTLLGPALVVVGLLVIMISSQMGAQLVAE